jgi:hypothetical protein
MSLSFVTPTAALVALVGLVALAVNLAGDRRVAQICKVLGVEPPPPRAGRGIKLAILALTGIVALALAQPVIARQGPINGRKDAEAFFVFDVTRSMGARLHRDSPTRLTRARAEALALRNELPGIPIGVASFTDRLLPHLFPTLRTNSFVSVIDRSLGIDKPPALIPWGNTNGTKIGALDELATQNYFPPQAHRRLAVVFTDGESQEFNSSTLQKKLVDAHIRLVFVRLWKPDERVFDLPGGTPNPYYTADPASGGRLDSAAATLGAPVFAEGRTGEIAAAVKARLGNGPDGERGRELQSHALGPLVLLLALVPLAYILWRRNLEHALAA